MPMPLDDYVKHLQELQAQGHGSLPLCYRDDESDWGWEALRPDDRPHLKTDKYGDEGTTRWCGRSGPFITL